MRWVLVGLAVVVALVVAVVVIGFLLPREHRVARRVVLPAAPEALWAVVTDYAAAPSWRPDIARVERQADRGDHPVWKEVDRHGNGIPYETTEAAANRRLVRVIADPELPFGGSWTLELAPAAGGTAVTIAEEGFVGNPIYRFVSVLVIGQKTYIDRYLTNLGRRFHSEVQPAAAP